MCVEDKEKKRVELRGIVPCFSNLTAWLPSLRCGNSIKMNFHFDFCFLMGAGEGAATSLLMQQKQTNVTIVIITIDRSKIYIPHIVRLGAATSSVVPSHFLFPPWWPVNITHQPPLFFFLFLTSSCTSCRPGPGEAAAARPSSRCAPAKTASQPPETCQSARKSK